MPGCHLGGGKTCLRARLQHKVRLCVRSKSRWQREEDRGDVGRELRLRLIIRLIKQKERVPEGRKGERSREESEQVNYYIITPLGREFETEQEGSQVRRGKKAKGSKNKQQKKGDYARSFTLKAEESDLMLGGKKKSRLQVRTVNGMRVIHQE